MGKQYKKLKVTENLYQKVVRLPLHSKLKKNEINHIIYSLDEYFKKK